MDKEQALRLAFSGGAVLVLDFPVGGTFGIDTMSWETGDKFKGIKMIPAGTHLVTYSMTNRMNGAVGGITSTVLLSVVAGGLGNDENITILRWNADTEALVPCDSGDATAYRAGVKRLEFDEFLAPYPRDIGDDWKELAGDIRPEDVTRVRPVDGGHVATSSQEDTSVLFFTKLPKSPKPDHRAGSALSKFHMDGTERLEYAEQKIGRDGLLAEVQLSFVLFLVGQSYEAFEQWKALLWAALTAEDAFWEPVWQAFFCKLCASVASQLKRVPADFFAETTFMPRLLTNFRAIASDGDEDEIPPPLRAALQCLWAVAVPLFGNLAPEDDEDIAPVVVDSSELGG